MKPIGVAVSWGWLLGAQPRQELPGLPGGRPALGRRPGPRARGQGGRRRRSTVRVTDDLGAVLSDDRVDAVAVATPAWTHFEVALACLEAGKHVLVEKPLRVLGGRGRELVAATARSGLVLMCDHTYCYTPAVRKLGELLGRRPRRPPVLRLGPHQPRSGPGGRRHLWDLAAHDLSILDFLLPDGHPPRPSGPRGPTRSASATPASATCRCQLAGGGDRPHPRQLAQPDQDPDHHRRRLQADRGLGRHQPGPAPVHVRQGRRPGPARVWRTVRREADGVLPHRRHGGAGPARGRGAGRGGQGAAAAVREGRPALTDGESGLRVLKVLEAVPRSLAAGGAGGLPAVNEENRSGPRS